MPGKSNSFGVCVITASLGTAVAGIVQSICRPDFSAYAFARSRLTTLCCQASSIPQGFWREPPAYLGAANRKYKEESLRFHRCEGCSRCGRKECRGSWE